MFICVKYIYKKKNIYICIWISLHLCLSTYIYWKDWCWSQSSNTLATWCKKLIYWIRPWCWERLKAGGEGSNRGWDGWMVSPDEWAWVWASSGRWWRTGNTGMGSQTVGHDLVAEQSIYCGPQAPLSMEFSRQEYWSGLHLLFQGIFLTQGSNTCLLHCRQIPYCLSHQETQLSIYLDSKW